jgi:hypothetical protein
MRPLILATLLTALGPFATAQRMSHGAGFHHPPHSPALLYYDPFYSDALYHEPSLSTPQPPVIILQSPPPPPVPERPSQPTQPLMIELQGDHYVRISGEDTSTAEMKQIDPTIPAHALVSPRPGKHSIIATPSPSPQQLPPLSSYSATAGAKKFPTIPSPTAFSTPPATTTPTDPGTKK